MEPTVFTELVNQIVPWVTDFVQAVGIFVYDVLLRFLGALWIISRITPWKWDNVIVDKAIAIIKSTKKDGQ